MLQTTITELDHRSIELTDHTHNVGDQRLDFGNRQPVPREKAGPYQHGVVFGEQGLGHDEGEGRSQHAVEDARHRGRGVAGQQPGNDHVGVDDDGRTAHDLRRTALT
mgnify:CR=1 FL=1